MRSNHHQWLIKTDNYRAYFGVQDAPDGRQHITIELDQLVATAPPQHMTLDFAMLDEAVKRGEALKDELTYQPGFAASKPDRVEELEDHTVKYYGRLRDNEEEQVVILIEKKHGETQPGESPRFLSDLEHLKVFAEAGREYREVVDRSEKWKPVLQIEGPGSDREHALAVVKRQCLAGDEPRHPRILSIRDGEKMADTSPALIVLPDPMAYRPVGSVIEVERVAASDADAATVRKINNAIEFAHFHAEREDSRFVIGRWALRTAPPRPREEVVIGGKPLLSDGTGIDYLVDHHGHADGVGIPDDAPYVLIDKSNSKRAFRGEVVGVYPSRDEAVQAIQEARAMVRQTERVLGPEWSHQQTGMNRRLT